MCFQQTFLRKGGTLKAAEIFGGELVESLRSAPGALDTPAEPHLAVQVIYGFRKKMDYHRWKNITAALGTF